MTTLGILNADSLVGAELVQLVGERPDLAPGLKLLTVDDETAGTLIDVGGQVEMVSALNAESAASLDAVFFCGQGAEAELETVPAEVVRILVSPQRAPEDALPIVAGVNERHADPARVLVSPHPAVVACALLLHPLARFHPATAAAWVLQSASIHGRAGLDELFEQSRSILNFRSEMPQDVFGGQLAFNAVPSPTDGGVLAGELRRVLETKASTAISLLQGGIFHGMLVTLHVACDGATGLDEICAALDSGHGIRRTDSAELGGPVAAASGDPELVAHATADPQRPGAFWITGILDNLIFGGAVNALAIAESVLPAARGAQPS